MITILTGLGVFLVSFGLTFLVNVWFYKSDYGTRKRKDYRKWRGGSKDKRVMYLALWASLVGLAVFILLSLKG